MLVIGDRSIGGISVNKTLYGLLLKLFIQAKFTAISILLVRILTIISMILLCIMQDRKRIIH